MQRKIQIGIVALVVLAVLVTGVVLVKHKQRVLQRVPAYANRPQRVTVVTVQQGDFAMERDYLAIVEPFETTRISARVSGALREIHVDEGASVSIGDVLAVLDDAEIRQTLAAAEARVAQARAEQEGHRATVAALVVSHAFWQAERARQTALAANGTIPEIEAERTVERAAEVEGRLKAAQQATQAFESQIEALTRQKDELDTRLSYYTLTSPLQGVVAQRRVDPGDLAMPHAPLFEIQTTNRWKVAFDVPQKDVPDIHRDSIIRFRLGDSQHEGTIHVLHPSLDKTRMMRAEAWIAATNVPGLVAGAYLPVRLTVKQLSDVALLPAAALIPAPDGGTHVFSVAENNTLVAQPVELLGRSGDTVAVRGVDPGTQIVRNTFLGWATLSAGDPVEVVQ
ncbi:MAG: efflux RND transporter periplasmic adaptor subunit [Roseovarius sp.]